MSDPRNPQRGSLNMRNIVLKSSLIGNLFKFIHINPGSLKPHLDDIRALVKDVNFHILAVSETWFSNKHNDHLVSLPGFTLIRHDRKNKRGGGVALYIKNGLKFKILFKSHPNACAEYLLIEIDNRFGDKIAFGVIYNPPRNKNLDPLKRDLSLIAEKYNHCVFVGDFNINLLKRDVAVNRFVNFLASINLCCPSNEPTNFVVGKNPSQIDWILVKNVSHLKRFSQLTLGSFSSHDIIFGSYAISMEKSLASRVNRFRNFNNLCKIKLQRAAACLDWDRIYLLSETDEQVEHLTNLIVELMDKFAPVREVEVIDEIKPCWLSDELLGLINARDYYHEVARVENNNRKKEEALIKFRELRNKVTTLKRNLKSSFVRDKLDPNQPPAKLWKNLKNLGVTAKQTDVAESFPPQEFNDYFSSVFSSESASRVNFEACPHGDGDFEFDCVSDEEVHIALMQITTNAIGEDGIPAVFLKLLCPFIIPFITFVINGCLTKSYFPTQWKVANVRPIPKESNPSSVSDFRPISILPSLSKVLERVMKEQMQMFVGNNNLLCSMQSGFRSGHSTNTAMMKVINDITAMVENDHVVVLSSLDLRKAFDLVDHGKLLMKLRTKFKFSTRACNLIKSYLSDRWQRVRIGNDYSELISVTSGTPQGGILSALLFSLFLNDLSEVVDIGKHFYADDSQFYCSAPTNNISDCIANMNASLNRVLNWTIDNLLSINPSKSKAIIISRKRVLSAPPVIIGDDVIEFCDRIKILGLTIDCQLSWRYHVERVCHEINGGLCMLRQSQSFTPKPTKKRLVEALLVPKFLYCSNIFMGCSRALWSLIKRTFNSCLRYIHNLRKFDSVSLHQDSLLGCPIENFIYYRACLFLFYLLRSGSPHYLYENLVIPRLPRNRSLRVPTARMAEQRKKSFFILGVQLWNSLDSEVRQTESAVAFKRECLAFFINKRYD